MAEAAVQQLRANICEMMLSGRIDAVRNYDGKFYTKVTIPAKDAFSMPSVFEISSQSKFGNIGEEFSNKKVFLSGYIREYKYTDKKTGEVKDGAERNVYLELVV